MPCRFALEPLTNDDQPRAPAFGVWLPESGRPLPRCEMFEYPLERLAVQQPLLSGTHISDRSMVAGWFDHVLATLRQQMTAATFDAWVRTTRLHQYNGNGRVMVAVTNARALDWLTHRLTEVFNRALSAEIGHKVHVEFVLDQPGGEAKR